jgi:L-threonylcarbamoyladenylate synthase
VSRDAIERVLGRALAAPRAETRAPGTLPSHYAPRARVIAVEAAQLGVAVRAALAPAAGASADPMTRGGPRTAALAPASVLAAAKLPAEIVRLALPDEPDAEARALYAALRELDARGVDTIVAALPAETTGVAEAIADRLRRAAGPREDGT